MNNTINKNSLTKAILYETGLPISIGEKIINQLFDDIIDFTAKNGGVVKIAKFGSFKVRYKKARPGRDLNTKAAVEIPARKIVSFQASSHLKLVINDATKI